ncbi:MAG TPA: DUF5640 domain-containing protein [Candidatus Elarobacter sp.]|nr:DUF5640 domain-containing protein [Candidatus Elarobacter sp.]
MTFRAPLAVLVPVVISALSLGAQAPSSLLGSWRAEQPLPNGIVQTFRFERDSGFELTSALAVDGTYQVEGNRLIQTVALPGSSFARADTATMRVSGDSLVVTEPASPNSSRVLRRTGVATPGAAPIVGDWTIALANGALADYRFDRDGTLHVRAQVASEHGTYAVSGDTLRLSDEQTFQIPAVTRYTVSDGVLTLTPPSGRGARRFARVASR